jgi:hypothetical protein
MQRVFLKTHTITRRGESIHCRWHKYIPLVLGQRLKDKMAHNSVASARLAQCLCFLYEGEQWQKLGGTSSTLAKVAFISSVAMASFLRSSCLPHALHSKAAWCTRKTLLHKTYLDCLRVLNNSAHLTSKCYMFSGPELLQL